MISVIIPCKTNVDLCPELLPALKNQSFNNFEILIITNKVYPADPARKRNWGANKAKGDTLAFIDSDAYPEINWLKSTLKQLKPKNIAAVCGPNLTPPQNNL